MGNTYCTRQVRVDQLHAQDPPPPPPPLPLAPFGLSLASASGGGSSESVGYCSLMGKGLGDCDHDSQGSFLGAHTLDECAAECRRCAGCHYLSVKFGGAAMARSENSSSNATAAPRMKPRVHPPHWWPCRWYRWCDLSDLRQTARDAEGRYLTMQMNPQKAPLARAAPPRALRAESLHHEGWGAAPPEGEGGVHVNSTRAIRLALVTLAVQHKDGYDMTCALLQWCQNARRLERVLPRHWHVARLVIGTGNDDWIAPSAGCAMTVVRAEASFEAAAGACAAHLTNTSDQFAAARGQVYGYIHKYSYFKKANLLKWMLFSLVPYDVILFADADVEIMPIAEASAETAGLWVLAVTRLLSHEAALLVADPDRQAPLNTGYMFLRPDHALYADGLRVVTRCLFNRSVGWDHVGRPVTSFASVQPLSLHSEAVERAASLLRAQALLRRTGAWRTNSWDFTSADCDQGFFFYMLYLRHRRGAYATTPRAVREDGGDRPFARHWWASFKPWKEYPLTVNFKLRTEAQYENMMKKDRDVTNLMRMYDFLVHLDEPGGDPRVTNAAVAALPCYVAERALRRAIERHSHFWEVHELWNAWPGVPGYVQLPM